MEELKNLLLNTGVVIDNKYLDKYVNLIVDNHCTKKQKFKTNKHHIIPRCYYRHNKLLVDNTDTNTVNLLYKDHLLAHYYLALCAKDYWFKEANFLVLSYVKFKSYDDFIKSLEHYQELYESVYGSKEYADKISKSLKGRIYVSKDDDVKAIDKKDLQSYLDNGYHIGNDKLKNKISITKDGSDLIIDKDDINKYLELGYKIGHTHKTSQSTRGYKVVHKNATETKIPSYLLDEYLSNGYKLGGYEANKRKKGHPNPYKGTKGKVKGGTKGMIYVTNGSCNKRIKQENLDAFLYENKDFKLGRTVKQEWYNDRRK